MVTLSSFFLFCPATFLYDMDFFGEIRNMSIFGTKYRFKWQAIAFQLDIDITFAECLKTEIWKISMNRGFCVLLMLCFVIAWLTQLLFIGLPEPPSWSWVRPRFLKYFCRIIFIG